MCDCMASRNFSALWNSTERLSICCSKQRGFSLRIFIDDVYTTRLIDYKINLKIDHIFSWNNPYY